MSTTVQEWLSATNKPSPPPPAGETEEESWQRMARELAESRANPIPNKCKYCGRRILGKYLYWHLQCEEPEEVKET